MQRQALTFLVCMLLVTGAHEAAAQVGQPWTDRAYFNLNGGFGSASETLSDATTFRVYLEDSNVTTSTNVDSGSLIDVSAGVRVWRNVSVGLGFHRGSNGGDGLVEGAVPNPLFFDRPRPLSSAINDLDRTEQAVHLQFGYMLPITDRLDMHIMVGPSFFRLKQEVTQRIEIEEGDFPFTNFRRFTPAVAARTDSSVGANAGIDVAYRLIERGGMNVGAGLFIRYAGGKASITLLEELVTNVEAGVPVATPRSVETTLGGLQFGLGARLRF